MNRVRKVAAIILTAAICFSFGACSFSRSSERTAESTASQVHRGPLDVKKVTYLVYAGDLCHVDMYVVSSDLKVTHYSINPEADKSYDYLAGEMPSEDRYEVTESSTDELSWSSIVNVLTRVNFMELKEDVSDTTGTDDGSSFYIKVETADGEHVSGGYNAGYPDDSESRRFAEAKEYIQNAVR